MKNKSIKQLAIVAASNISMLITGIIVGFIIPKIFSVADYGYYKTYTLYIHYASIFSLGIVDGMILEYGKLDYQDLNKNSFRSLFSIYGTIQLVFSLIIIAASLFMPTSAYAFIAVMLAVNLVITNITGYFTQISQFTMRFRELSLRTFLKAVITLVSVICLFFLWKYEIYTVDYKGYLLVNTGIGFLLMLWYLCTYRDIVIGCKAGFCDARNNTSKLMKRGIPLLLANSCSNLLLVADRQFVNLLFDNETYAKYSFAYTMLSLVTVMTSSVSTVLFPSLKRSDALSISKKYKSLITVLSSISFLCMATYYPICMFVKWYLPKYIDSLQIFMVVFPTLAISTVITVVINNYYKTLNQEKLFFTQCAITLLVSILANVVAYFLFKSTVAISVASLLVTAAWYLVSDIKMQRQLGISDYSCVAFMTLGTIAFFIISNIESYLAGFFIYTAVIAVLCVLFYRKEYCQIIRLFRTKK